MAAQCCGCLAFLKSESASSGSGTNHAASDGHQNGVALAGDGVREQVRATVRSEVQFLSTSLAAELKSAASRITKVKAGPLASRDYRPSLGHSASAGPALGRKAITPDPVSDAMEEVMRAPARLEKRRWTTDLGLRSNQDMDSRLSLLRRHSVSWDHDVDDHSDEEDADEGEDADDDGQASSSSSARSGESNQTSHSNASLFRADALDFGDRLAAGRAARKGRTSVDSIVNTVQAERERWADEKSALEVRLDELREQRSIRLAGGSRDPEKQALKQQVKELRETMRSRTRFGAWLCERHCQESEEEDEDVEDTTLTKRDRAASTSSASSGSRKVMARRRKEREMLRLELDEVRAELREARAEAVRSQGGCR